MNKNIFRSLVETMSDEEYLIISQTDEFKLFYKSL